MVEALADHNFPFLAPPLFVVTAWVRAAIRRSNVARVEPGKLEKVRDSKQEFDRIPIELMPRTFAPCNEFVRSSRA